LREIVTVPLIFMLKRIYGWIDSKDESFRRAFLWNYFLKRGKTCNYYACKDVARAIICHLNSECLLIQSSGNLHASGHTSARDIEILKQTVNQKETVCVHTQV